MLYTNEEINKYRAGWLETHPDEVLNDATVVDCLNDERAAMIEALIDNDLRAIERGSDLIRQVLTWGWEGYEYMQTIELRDEMKLRGLEL